MSKFSDRELMFLLNAVAIMVASYEQQSNGQWEKPTELPYHDEAMKWANDLFAEYPYIGFNEMKDLFSKIYLTARRVGDLELINLPPSSEYIH